MSGTELKQCFFCEVSPIFSYQTQNNVTYYIMNGIWQHLQHVNSITTSLQQYSSPVFLWCSSVLPTKQVCCCLVAAAIRCVCVCINFACIYIFTMKSALYELDNSIGLLACANDSHERVLLIG